MAYLVDANVLITAKRQHYGFEFCPAFWDWLVRENAAGNVFSVEMVGNELTAGTDQLASWAGARGPGFFLPPDASVTTSLAKVGAWLPSSPVRYEPAAIATFLRVAAYFLIGQALAGSHTIVTHETVENTTKRVKSPTCASASGSSACSRS